MASKRHRKIRERPPVDPRRTAHRLKREQDLAPQVDDTLYLSRPRRIHCTHCDETFYAAELQPQCPSCERVLIVSGRH